MRARPFWSPDGRSEATIARAEAAGIDAAPSFDHFVAESEVIVSVCPPGAAGEVAARVADAGFGGVYVDVNAIAPHTARAIAGRFAEFVDGGIVGPPVTRAGTTRLYLSGDGAGAVAQLWSDSPLEVRVIDGPIGAASAVKTGFATWTKASSAMLLTIRALARAEGVEDALDAEWATSMPDLAARVAATATATAPKAWRFVGEMEEHRAAFEAVGLPGDFSAAAAEVYRRMADLREVDGADLEAVLDVLTASDVPTDPRLS